MVEAVAYGLEPFFCEVTRYVEDVEEFECLGEGISSGEIKRCKPELSVSDLNHEYRSALDFRLTQSSNSPFVVDIVHLNRETNDLQDDLQL